MEVKQPPPIIRQIKETKPMADKEKDKPVDPQHPTAPPEPQLPDKSEGDEEGDPPAPGDGKGKPGGGTGG